MPSNTVTRRSILKQVLQADGKTVLKEIGRTTGPSGGSVTSATKATQTSQNGRSINALEAPSLSPAAVVPQSGLLQKTYYIELSSHNLTALITAGSVEEAWGKFANINGIVATERDALITEFS